MTLRVSTLIVCCALLLTSAVLARDPIADSLFLRFSEQSTALDSPAVCLAVHDVGNMRLVVSNNGTFGLRYSRNHFCFRTDTIMNGCEFPKSATWAGYLALGSIWIGAVSRGDTLVSIGGGLDYAYGNAIYAGGELFPEVSPNGEIIYRSTSDPQRPEFVDAVSEQDFIAKYADTCRDCPGMTKDQMDFRSHRPARVAVTQRTYAWSYPYASSFVLFDLSIRNIGAYPISKMYIGVHVDSDANWPPDDIGGFRTTLPAFYSKSPSCKYDDTVNLAWVADNGQDKLFVPNVTATRIVRLPTDDAVISYNWWVGAWNQGAGFGPQRASRIRDFGTGGDGLPTGDRNKYWLLRNGEHDYDQIYSYANSLGEYPQTVPQQEDVRDIADGADIYYLLSMGPFNLSSGQSLPLSFAYVGGLNFHSNPENFLNLPDNPDEYYRNVDFSNLAYNATWADWVYDNPGCDTDSDGYFGKFHLCQTGDSTFLRADTIYNADSSQIVFIDSVWKFENEDTIWYKGDGVPDFRAASPPPRPDIRTIMATGKIVVQFNGWRSETARDFFTHKVDFEGYRVYLSRDDRWSSFSLLDTYDKENYDKFVWDTAVGDPGEFVLKDDPFTMQQLQCLYAPAHCTDSSWNPLIYTRNHPYQSDDFPDSIFYFTRHDFNRSEPGVNTNIKKRYPEAPFPKSLNKDSCLASDTTEEGYFKHFEYEYTIDNLLPTVPYYISVTTFDFGAQNLGMPPMESPRTENPIHTYAQESSDSVVAKGMKVTVYPNPYRLDAGYARLGYEGTGPGERDRPSDRNRRIHFYNLPADCTIKIFSLDGDLVRQLDHHVPSWDPMSNHETWDLITRNTQLVVSGLYYWTVESDGGQVQIGKLVIIL